MRGASAAGRDGSNNVELASLLSLPCRFPSCLRARALLDPLLDVRPEPFAEQLVAAFATSGFFPGHVTSRRGVNNRWVRGLPAPT